MNGQFNKGQFTAVVGPNGGGKSSLLNVLAGVNSKFEGCISEHADYTVAYFPQLHQLNMDFPCSVMDFVMMGLWREVSWFRRLNHEHPANIQKALDTVGLNGVEQQLLSKLSSGQLQRALFARLIVQNVNILLLDERFNSMDTNTQNDLMQILEHSRKEARTVIAVLHDHNLVRNHFEQTLLLARSSIAWGDTNTVLIDEQLHKAQQLSLSWGSSACIWQPKNHVEVAAC